jgi:hypothetical protein
VLAGKGVSYFLSYKSFPTIQSTMIDNNMNVSAPSREILSGAGIVDF